MVARQEDQQAILKHHLTHTTMTHIPKTMSLVDGEIRATVRALNDAHTALHKVVSKQDVDIDDRLKEECLVALAEVEAVIQHVYGSLVTERTKEAAK